MAEFGVGAVVEAVAAPFRVGEALQGVVGAPDVAGGVAVGVQALGEAALGIVVALLRVTLGVHMAFGQGQMVVLGIAPLLAVVFGVEVLGQAPERIVAVVVTLAVGGGDLAEVSGTVPGVAALATAGMVDLAEATLGVVGVGHDFVQGIVQLDEVAAFVVVVAPDRAQGVGVGERAALLVAFDFLALAVRVGDFGELAPVVVGVGGGASQRVDAGGEQVFLPLVLVDGTQAGFDMVTRLRSS